MDRSRKSAGMLSLLASGITFGALPIFVTWLTWDGISGWFQLATRIGLSAALSLVLLQIFSPHLVRAGRGRPVLVLVLNGLLTLMSFTTYMFSITLGTSPPKAALLV
jgi:EamA domain-containing membrane protein RarD